LTPEQHELGLELAETLLMDMAPAKRRKLTLFFVVINMLALLRFGRTTTSLPTEQRARLCRFLFDNPVGLLRKGFWGVNTLARLSVYGQPELAPHFGYLIRENPDD
ncbi:MAG: hypothetical protein D6761_12075, partial [Candidatus Dadabacteria bacterium]